MTVSELIKHLQNCPGDMRVLTLGYEGGLDDINVMRDSVVFNTNSEDARQVRWYIGKHEYASMVDNSNGIECVIIGRGK
jgi:hypothetical protein